MTEERSAGSKAAQAQIGSAQNAPPQTDSFVKRAVAALARLITWILRVGTYAYLLRVAIIIGLTLFLFPFAALLRISPLRSLFQNLFLMGPWPTFWSTIAALVLAWSLLLTGRIVLLNCKDRFGVKAYMKAADLSGIAVFGILLLALPSIAGQFTQRADFGTENQTARVVAVLVAMVLSYCLAFAALWLAVLLAPPNTQGSALTFPCLPLMKNWLRWADAHHVLPSTINPGLWIRNNLPAGLWRGYLAYDGFMWSGHWLALLFGTASFLLYLFVGWWHARALGGTSGVTALTFVLLLLMNANWLFAFLTFFLDRFRVPLLIPLALFAIISGNQRSSDHYFRVKLVSGKLQPVSARDVLRAREGRPLVVVATAGGGIQAAAWTVEVLSGLEDLYKAWKLEGTFAGTVTAISSVSGGATGSMFHLSLFDPADPQHFRMGARSDLLDRVSKSSLDDIAWALVYHDLPRILIPSSSRFSDRGSVLEQTWAGRVKVSTPLATWRVGAVEGWRPVAIFNSTITESGEPLVLSTSDWKPEMDAWGVLVTPRRKNFYDIYPNHDLSVVSAVRLAATFPYVTPAARPDTDAPNDYHMIDGGYYDNFGISALIAWLEQGLRDLERDCEADRAKSRVKTDCKSQVLPRILFLQIRSFPPDEVTKPTKKGWAFQLYAPLKGILSVRSTAQLVRDREELSMFARRWEPEQAETSAAKIQFATLEFGGFKGSQKGSHKDKAISPPLSWAMNPAQVQAVKDDWTSRYTQKNPAENDPNIDKIRCFFQPEFCISRPMSYKPE